MPDHPESCGRWGIGAVCPGQTLGVHLTRLLLHNGVDCNTSKQSGVTGFDISKSVDRSEGELLHV